MLNDLPDYLPAIAPPVDPYRSRLQPTNVLAAEAALAARAAAFAPEELAQAQQAVDRG